MRTFDLVIDDSVRQNVDIIYDNDDDQDCTAYCESLYEVMNDIKDYISYRVTVCSH